MSGCETRTVYLLHGLLETSVTQYSRVLPLWKQAFTVVPLDLPGHGRCRVDASDAYFDAAIAYCIAILERFGSGHIVGSSYLGGPVAVRVALARPDLVNSLTLSGFAPNITQAVFVTWLESFGHLAETNAELVRWYEARHGLWRQTFLAVQ